MPTTLYLAPNTGAAFAHAMARVAGLQASKPLAPVYVLLPGAPAIREARERLGNTAGVRLHQFYALGRAVLDAASQPVHEIGDTAARRLVRQLLTEAHEAGELTSFDRVWDRPGFTQALLEWLREMKAQGVAAEQIGLAAEASGSARDRQLALLYSRYQAFLIGHDCSDADGLLWLAAEALEGAFRVGGDRRRGDPPWPPAERAATAPKGGAKGRPYLETRPALEAPDAQPGLLDEAAACLALGFDQFSPIQLRILAALAGRLPEVAVYLPWDQGRPPQSLALTRLRATRAALEKLLDPQVIPLDGGGHSGIQIVESGQPEDEDGPPPALAHLRRALFEPEATPAVDGDPPAVRALAAPSREAEVREALRAAKRLLLHGARPGRVALACPQIATYARVVQAVAEEYGIPVAVEQPLPLNPAVAALLNLLALAPDFARRETLDALRSPYIRQDWVTREQVDALDRLSRERPVLTGREQWRSALQPLAQASGAAEGDNGDEDLGGALLAASIPPEQLAAIEAGLFRFFDHLAPPASATHRDYALWLQDAILGLAEDEDDESDGSAGWVGSDPSGRSVGRPQADQAPLPAGEPPASLAMLACCQAGPFAARDLAAVGAVTAALAGIVGAADLVPAGDGGRVTWPTFREELGQALAAQSLRPAHGSDAVRCLPLSAARALIVDHLFVLGLAEGEFPRPPQPDLFYAPAEREASPLALARVEPGEDASLWWQVIGNCERSLTILRPYLDENGAEWLPSPYWDATLACIDGLAGRVARLSIGATPASADAAGRSELLVALALADRNAPPAELGLAWAAARAAYDVMAERHRPGPCGAHEGVLRDAELQAGLARRYGPDHTWSASRLNRFGACPYSFFASSALALEPLAEPEEGIDALQRGSLIHHVLELLFRDLARSGLAPEPGTEAEVLERLDACCERVFAFAPARYGFRPGALWRYEQEELRRMLRALLSWECSEKDAGRFRPWLQEVRFGVKGSRLPALYAAGPDGQGCYIHGVIDRIDRDEAGRLRVADYKSGSAAFTEADILAGRALQTALYALAASEALPGRPPVVESYFLHVATHKRSGRITPGGLPADDAVVQGAAAQAAAFAADAARGEFASGPGKVLPGRQACTYTCDYAALCAPSRRSIAKARRHIQEVRQHATH